MNEQSPTLGRPGLAARRTAALGDRGLVALLVGVALATVALGWLSNGEIAVTAAPVLVTAIVMGMCVAPLRWTAMVLIFLLLALDDYSNAMGAWHTPWAIIQELLVQNVDRVVPALRGFKLSGLELIAILLLGVALYRRYTGNTIDSRGRTPVAKVMAEFMVVFLVAILFATANGLLRGGSPEIAIWQARPLLHLLILFVLFNAAFRGAADLRALGRLIVVAAILKASLATWVYYATTVSEKNVGTATSHGDSVLFAMACTMLIVHLMERTDRKRLVACLLFLPPILLGMKANTRRLVWVELVSALAVAYLLSPWRPWKRAATRFGIAMIPVVLLYAAIGWNSSSAIFAPLSTFRSISETNRDRSTFFRHVENWNLVVNMDDHPILGRGFGHEFVEFYKNDDISFFAQYKAEPHNQVLGLLLFGGFLAFNGIWLTFAVGVYLAARAYRAATVPEERAGAMCCIAAIIICLNQVYGDLGPYLTPYKVILALALVMAGKLAVSTGAWPARVRPASA
jgi:hypothetical protein